MVYLKRVFVLISSLFVMHTMFCMEPSWKERFITAQICAIKQVCQLTHELQHIQNQVATVRAKKVKTESGISFVNQKAEELEEKKRDIEFQLNHRMATLRGANKSIAPFLDEYTARCEDLYADVRESKIALREFRIKKRELASFEKDFLETTVSIPVCPPKKLPIDPLSLLHINEELASPEILLVINPDHFFLSNHEIVMNYEALNSNNKV